MSRYCMLAGWSALQRENEEPHICGGATVPLAPVQPQPAGQKAGGKWYRLNRAGVEAALCVTVPCVPF